MDITILTILAILAIWVSINSRLAVIYLIYFGKLRGYRISPKVKTAIPKKATPTKDEKPVLIDEQQGAWGLQIKFSDPTMASNERLAAMLASVGAVYDSTEQCFTISGDSPRNPILIVNGYSPNTLPSFMEDNGQFPVKGVNVKLVKRKKSSTPNKMQLVRLVEVAKKLERIGGDVVDAENKKMTQSGYQAVIDGKAVF